MNDKLTQSAQQTLKFFEEFIRRKAVADFIKKYRKYLNLPPNGLVFTNENRKELEETLVVFLYIPSRVRQLLPEEEKKKPMRVMNTCMALVAQEGVNSFYINAMLSLFLFYNEVIDYPLRILDAHDDLLKLEHLPSELSWYDNEDYSLLKYAYEHFEQLSKKYPIALYINPDVSQRQIQDFISKNWAFIEAHRKDTKANISGFRKKKKTIQERNDFIYENQQLPRKEIMRLLYEKYGEKLDIDYGYIGKIISLEKKRRETK